jgi:hypothetical protein
VSRNADRNEAQRYAEEARRLRRRLVQERRARSWPERRERIWSRSSGRELDSFFYEMSIS